jgi:hypothetical protein
MELSFLARNRYTLLVSVTLNASIFAYPTPYDTNGSLLRWPSELPTVKYSVEDDYEGIGPLEVVKAAAEMWSDVPLSRLKLTYTTNSVEAQILINIIDPHDGQSFSSGYSEFDRFSSENDPEHCSIYIYRQSYGITLSMAKTILHEIGHCLGLGHSLIPQSIMSYHLAHNAFALDIDDKAAISRLYSYNAHPSLPAGCGILIPQPGFSSWLWWCLLALPLLLIILPFGRSP